MRRKLLGVSAVCFIFALALLIEQTRFVAETGYEMPGLYGVIAVLFLVSVALPLALYIGWLSRWFQSFRQD